MTFLELCQRLRQEVGAAGNGPANVAGQSGEYARLIGWIRQAWREIQLDRQWRFDWARGVVELNASDVEYPLPEDFDDWLADTLYVGAQKLRVLPWKDLRHAATDRLSCVAIAPDGVLHLNTTPDAGTTLTFEYWRTPQELVGINDVPRMPPRYHMAIVYRAMMQYGLYENAPEVVQQARLNDQQMMTRIASTELPTMTLGGPLA
ncbi:MAG: hypothetical protein CME80_08480 [Halomonas sp.]|nr:hypothetical protein [Halomonas sp.]MBF57740.1 hypothetical protein [Halomonas sp.]|tara:strand:+ start:32747 stop:33361 length:615 start_codon:yes stop_codon:yes gene_type:complete